MPAAEARGCWDPPPEAEGGCLGLQAPGGRHPLHIQNINNEQSALFLETTASSPEYFGQQPFCVSDMKLLSFQCPEVKDD